MNPLSNRALRAYVATSVCLLLSSSFAKEVQRPSIVWMFSDDHAYQAIGAYGGRFKDEKLTPNIDSLAKDGMLSKSGLCERRGREDLRRALDGCHH